MLDPEICRGPIERVHWKLYWLPRRRRCTPRGRFEWAMNWFERCVYTWNATFMAVVGYGMLP